ncbi:hypothetical protein GCM10027614_41460 [Micromonospora vulcania]
MRGYDDPAGGGGAPPWARQDGPTATGSRGEPGPVGGGPAHGGPPGEPGPAAGPPHDGGTARGAEEPPEPDGPDAPESGSTTDPVVPDHASEAELRLLGREVHSMTELDPGGHVNDAYDVTFTDGTHGVYKPNVPENEFVQVRSTIPEDQLAAREVAASRLDEDLGFDLVPTTARWDGPHGSGSMQEFVENASPGRPPAPILSPRASGWRCSTTSAATPTGTWVTT